MIAAFRRLAARSRLTKARRAFDVARAEYAAASVRQDTRRMAHASRDLRLANRELLEAEMNAQRPRSSGRLLGV